VSLGNPSERVHAYVGILILDHPPVRDPMVISLLTHNASCGGPCGMKHSTRTPRRRLRLGALKHLSGGFPRTAGAQAWGRVGQGVSWIVVSMLNLSLPVLGSPSSDSSCGQLQVLIHGGGGAVIRGRVRVEQGHDNQGGMPESRGGPVHR
jgi:hypothetical protein